MSRDDKWALLKPIPKARLDLVEWKEEVAEAAEATPQPPPSRVPTQQLYAWAHDVETQLRTIDTRFNRAEKIPVDTLFDWAAPEVQALDTQSTDLEVVRLLQRAHYPIVRALFWIQRANGCLTELHLMQHIVTSAHWTEVFCETMRVLSVVSRTHGTEKHNMLKLYVQKLHQVADRPQTLRAMPPPGKRMGTAPPLMLSMVRQMTNMPEMDKDELDLVMRRIQSRWFDGIDIVSRASGTLHSLFVLARLATCYILPSRTNSQAVECVRVLLVFFAQGCKCPS